MNETSNELVTQLPDAALPDITTPIAAGSPLDLPVAVFRQGLQRRGENRAALIEWVRQALVENMDFGRVQTKRGLSKPSLFKPGSEKICGMLGVTPVFPTLSRYEDAALAGHPIEAIILRCELVNSNGEIVASGIGARSVQADCGDLNKALKMAAKSAMIDATLRLGGLSEVFTQDVEDMPPHQVAQPQRAQPQPGCVPCGKYKDSPWSDVSDDYLDWCVNTDRDIPRDLRGGAERELQRREAMKAAPLQAVVDFDDELPF